MNENKILCPSINISSNIIFWNNFSLFEESKKEILKIETDHEGIRQAIIYTNGGDATLNPSICVSIKMGEINENNIFIADRSFINGDEVNVFWKSFDTLKINYNTNLRIFKQERLKKFDDSTLDIVIIYEEIN